MRTDISKFALLFILMLIAALGLPGCGDDDDDDDSSGTPSDDDDDNDAIDDDDDATDDDTTPDDDDDDIVDPPAYFSYHPFLTDINLWSGYADSKDLPRPREVGEFGVGNGRVFALVGTKLPYHTLRNIIGPDYERNPMFFSDKQFNIQENGQNVLIAEQWDMRVRKTPITLTRSIYTNKLEMHTIDYAPKGGEADDDMSERALIRTFIFRNIGSEKLSGLELRTQSILGKNTNGVISETIENKHLDFRPATAPFPAGKSSGTLTLPSLEPGQENTLTMIFAFTYDGEDPDDVFSAVNTLGIETLLDETYDWWVDWYDQAAVLTTPDKKFNDLIESLQITIKVQQAFTGASCVMSEYTRTWIRDIVGPAWFYSPLGRTDDVKDILDYYYMASLERGNISNSFNSDIVLSTWPTPPDWRNLPTMGGRQRGEAPSYISLQYKKYYDYTGDLTTLDDRFDFLYHTLAHQDFHEGCLLPWSGDETFRELMNVAVGFPIGTVYEDFYLSSNSSFLWAAAADFMAELAGTLNETADVDYFTDKAQEVRDCTEDYYWVESQGYYAVAVDVNTFEQVALPYEDVNTKPLWSGAESPEDQHQIDAFLSFKDRLYFEPGVVQSPPASPYDLLFDLFNIQQGIFSGMTQGYYLDNLARLDHPEAEDAFNLWKVLPNDSGNVSEAMVRDDYARLMYLIEPFGFLSDLTSRYRPWEGGIWGASMLYYVTGFEASVPKGTVSFAPHMPDGWDHVTFEGAPFGDETLSAEVTDDGQSRTFTLTNGGGAYNLTLTLAVPGDILSLTINGQTQDLSGYTVTSNWGRSHVVIGPVAIEAQDEFEAVVTY